MKVKKKKIDETLALCQRLHLLESKSLNGISRFIYSVSTATSSNPKDFYSGTEEHDRYEVAAFTPINLHHASVHILLMGTISQIKGEGSINVLSSLTLPTVLHVTQFPHNLVSVGSLTKIPKL